MHSINDNPAGLANIKRINATFMHLEWMGEMDYEYFAYVQPFSKNVFGISALFFHLPSFIHFGDYGEEVGDINISDFAFSLTYSRNVYNINFGIGAKFIYRTLDKYNASAFAVDFGLLKELNLFKFFKDTPENNFSVGASIKNFGTQVKFISESDYLPTVFNFGIVYKIIDFLMFSGQVDKPLTYEKKKVYFKTGVEGAVYDILFIRGGYKINDNDNKFSLGGGIKIKIMEIISYFDYALLLNESFNNSHAISLKVIF